MIINITPAKLSSIYRDGMFCLVQLFVFFSPSSDVSNCLSFFLSVFRLTPLQVVPNFQRWYQVSPNTIPPPPQETPYWNSQVFLLQGTDSPLGLIFWDFIILLVLAPVSRILHLPPFTGAISSNFRMWKENFLNLWMSRNGTFSG